MYRAWNDSYELGRGLTRPDCHQPRPRRPAHATSCRLGLRRRARRSIHCLRPRPVSCRSRAALDPCR
jgi:hypothetical protein